MSDISSINSSSRVHPTVTYEQRNGAALNGTHHHLRDTEADDVEISEDALLLSRLRELPDIREALVNRVRSEIESGAYETPEKLDAAIASLRDDIDLFG